MKKINEFDLELLANERLKDKQQVVTTVPISTFDNKDFDDQTHKKGKHHKVKTLFVWTTSLVKSFAKEIYDAFSDVDE